MPPKMMRSNDLCSAAFYGDVKKLKELLDLPPVEDDPPLEGEFDPMAPEDPEEKAAAADRQKRRNDNAAELSRRINYDDFVVTRLSAVNKRTFGLFVEITEAEEVLSVKYKLSPKSTWKASPLVWAAIGREHEALAYLVMRGADTKRMVPDVGVSVWDILRANKLRETEKVLRKAIASKAEKDAEEEKKRKGREDILLQRQLARQKAIEDQRRKEEEERLEAERQAKAEADATEAANRPPAEAAEGEGNPPPAEEEPPTEEQEGQ